MKKAIAFLLVLVPSVVAAQKIGPRHACVPAVGSAGLLLDSQTLAETRNFTITDEVSGIRGMGVLMLLMDLESQNTVTRVDLDCFMSDDGGTTKFHMQSCSTAAGACTSSDATFQKTVAAADQWEWRVDVLGLAEDLDLYCEVSVGAGAGTATDIIEVNGWFCTQ